MAIEGAGRRPSIRRRMSANKARGIATSAIRKVKSRPWHTSFAPILMSFSRSEVRAPVFSCLRQR